MIYSNAILSTLLLTAGVSLSGAQNIRGGIIPAERNLADDDFVKKSDANYQVTSRGLRTLKKPSGRTRVAFPPVETSEFVHGFCLNSREKNFYGFNDHDTSPYKTVSGFGVGTQLWGDREYTVQKGSDLGPCGSGQYLQPKIHKEMETGTVIVVGVDTGKPFTLCALVEEGNLDRDGDWPFPLKQSGFQKQKEPIYWEGDFKKNDPKEGKVVSYCRDFYN